MYTLFHVELPRKSSSLKLNIKSLGLRDISLRFEEGLLISATYNISCMVFCKCSDLALSLMFHPREWAQCEISQLSRTPLVTHRKRALQSKKGSQWMSLNNQSKRKSDDELAIKWLHSKQRRYEKKTSGSRIKGKRKGWGRLWEIFSCRSIMLHSFSFISCDGYMPSIATAGERAGDRAEMSAAECIEFIQSGELLENKSGKEREAEKLPD